MSVTLSARLEAILSLLSPCALLADVGTDHGLIPIAAVQRGIAQRAIAADLRAAPLQVARQNIADAGVEASLTVVQGDGLAALVDLSLDAVVMAGVSGALIVRVLSAAPARLRSVSQLVLQPNQEVELVRAWAFGHGFHLHAECMIEERGFFFPVCAFRAGTGDDAAYAQSGVERELAYQVGPLLLARKDAVARRWCQEQCGRIEKLVQQRGVRALEPELVRLRALLARFA